MTSKPIDGYIRVSRRGGREGPGYITKDVQREAIERWAAYKGVEIGEWFIDEDWSGGTHDRPGLEAAIERAVSGVSGGLVSWKIDRFSRYTEGGLRDLHRLDKAGARLAFVVEDIDTSGPMGKFVYTIMLAMSTYFLDNIKAGWREAKSRGIKRGVHIGPTPLGYERTRESTLVPHPTEAAIVKAAYKAAVDHGTEAAMEILSEAAPVHLTGKRAGQERTWTPGVVRRLLKNRVYLGEVRYGDGLVNAKAHDPLVDMETFRRAQRLPSETRTRGREYPLSHLARCKSCGHGLVGSYGGTDKRRIYRCSKAVRRKGEKCDAPVAVSAELLERHVLDALRAAWEAPTFAVGGEPTLDLDALTAALDDAEEELSAFAGHTKARKLLGEAEWDSALEARVIERDAAQGALDAAMNDQRPQRALALTEEDWTTLGSEDLRDVVSGALRAVVVDRGRRPLDERVALVQHTDEAEAATQDA